MSFKKNVKKQFCLNFYLFEQQSGVTSVMNKNFLDFQCGATEKVTANKTIQQQSFWNLSFDKGRVKSLVSWFLKKYGQKRTIQLVENLKNIGFEYATKAGISLGIDDLKISPNKSVLISEAEKQTYDVITQYKRAEITGVERFQRLIDTWHRTSENLKQEVINYFEMTDLLNPVYMMAFSGARGNISQVRQLVGMRGLMADPKGQILDFPIRSNFREGLTLTEYLISSYGARKGIVDTALRTANAGYLTRRLVDVAQHVIVSHYDCGTKKGILVTDMKEGTKIIYSLQNRLIGRVLAQDIYSLKNPIAFRNQEISSELALKISKSVSKVLIRSALTCDTRKLICQLCYGWSLGQGKLVSIGDAVGVIAGQSIGEPGTQLTMRTFHTGGVFSSDVNDQIIVPYNGIIEYSSYIPGTLVRTPQGKIAFLTKAEGSFIIKNLKTIDVKAENTTKLFKIPSYTLLFCRHKEQVYFKQVIAQICSGSTQNKQRDDAEQSIQSELQGEVYMDRLTLIEQTTDYEDINQQSWDWGSIWILSGKIYEIPVDSYIFPKFGDFVNKNSVLNQIQWISPQKSLLNIHATDNLFSQCIYRSPEKKNLTNFNFKTENLNLGTNISSIAINKNFSQSSKNLPRSSINFKFIKNKFDNISINKLNINHSSNMISPPTLVGKYEPKVLKQKFSLKKDEMNNIKKQLRNSAISADLRFKKPLLLFDTNKFSYKKLGYFFKINLPLSINHKNFSSFKTKTNRINIDDQFFIPVGLDKDNKFLINKFLQNKKLLENSFDWKIFPHTFLTWFPFNYQTFSSGIVSYEIPTIFMFKSNYFSNIDNLILKQHNSVLYSKFRQNVVKSSITNLNYNQSVFSKKNRLVFNKSKSIFKESKNKNFWFFSDKQKKDIFKINFKNLTFPTKNLNSNSYFQKYSELRWKNSKTYFNKEFFYRGRIFWVPQQSTQFLALEINNQKIQQPSSSYFDAEIPISLNQDNTLNSQRIKSLLYCSLTRQGKKIPVNTTFDGLIQVYKKALFFNENLNSHNKYSMFDRFKYNKNKKYYTALKFKLLKNNKYSGKTWVNQMIYPSGLNTSCFTAFSFKQYKKVAVSTNDVSKYINQDKLNQLSSFNNVKNNTDYYLNNLNSSSIKNDLAKSNFLKLIKIKNFGSLISRFKFPFFSLNNFLEKKLISEHLKYRISNINLQIKSGWIYIPTKLSFNLIKYNKSIVPLGQILCDDIIFDRTLVYIECIPINIKFQKYKFNFLNAFNAIEICNDFSFQNNIYSFIKQKYTAKKRLSVKKENFNFSLMNLKWVVNKKTKNLDITKEFYKNSNVNNEFKKDGVVPQFFLKGNLSNFNSTKYILVIKKVKEYHLQNSYYYKKKLYNSQTKNFKTNLSFLFKQNYHTLLLNKQRKNSKLIAQFPSVDIAIEPVFKSSSLSLPINKVKKFSKKFTLLPNNKKNMINLYFFKKPINLLYFKLHFTNNSSLKMFFKIPTFYFNYIQSPHLSTIPSVNFNYMYTEVLSNLLKRSDSLAMVSDNTIINKKLDNISSKNLLFILFFNKNISKLFFTPCFDFSLTQNSSYFLNDRFFVRTRLSNIFSSINTKNIGLSLSYKKTNSSESLTNFFPVVKNSYIFGTDDNLLEKQPFAYSSFLSPYEGEILLKNQNNWNTTFQKNRMLIVTKKDFVSFNLKNVDSRSIVESESISTHNDIFIKFSKQVYKIDNLILSEPASNNVFLIGEFIFYGDSITRNIGIPHGGQVVHLNNNKLTIRKGQSIFLSSKAILHAYNGDFIDKNFPVVTLPYQKLKAGDIVQGIPKIEQFFEARITRGGRLFRDSIPNLLKGLFKRYKIKYSSPKAVRQSFYKIQQILVDGVQRVYRSQGVTIADKHIEIIVKQMTCKVKIINGGQTGFFPGELVDLEFVEQINEILMKKIYYEPVVLGITKASLEVESFLSAASFQQTTRILSKAAIGRKKDFLKGLKENVIVGNLIPAGTGYLIYLKDLNQSFTFDHVIPLKK